MDNAKCKECGTELAVTENSVDWVLGECRVAGCPLFSITIPIKGEMLEPEPKTALEAVEHLETFLVADFGQKDWSPKFLRQHFAICKSQIKNIEGKV